MQCFFAISAGTIFWFLPDTPRWYYARGRIAEGDAALSQLNDADVSSEAVQNTKKHIMTAIEIEVEANASLHWYQFLGLGIVDNTKLKTIRRLMICFWLPMVSWSPRTIYSVGRSTRANRFADWRVDGS